MQLGILGKCKVQFLRNSQEEIHLAYVIRKIIKATIERKGTRRLHDEDDNGEVDESQVTSLAYAESKKFLRWREESWYFAEIRNGSYCDGFPASLTMLRRAPFVMQEPPARAEVGSGDTEVGL